MMLKWWFETICTKGHNVTGTKYRFVQVVQGQLQLSHSCIEKLAAVI